MFLVPYVDKKVEGHKMFRTAYIPWLNRHINAGSFTANETYAQAQAELQNLEAMAEKARQEAAEKRRQAEEKRRIEKERAAIIWPHVVAGVVGLFGLVLMIPAINNYLWTAGRVVALIFAIIFLLGGGALVYLGIVLNKKKKERLAKEDAAKLGENQAGTNGTGKHPTPVAPHSDASIPPGTAVVIQAPDGNGYPGTVVQFANEQYLCSFENGSQGWYAADAITVQK